MRWTKGIKNDYRLIKRFALLPIKVNNEYRWLETCYIVQERWYSWYEASWCNISWTDKITYLRWKKSNSRYKKCYCAGSDCKYNLEGQLCMLGNGAVITNDGICYSREEKYYGSKEHNS